MTSTRTYIDRSDLEALSTTDLSEALRTELDAPDPDLFFAAEFTGEGFRTGNGVQIAYFKSAGRAGLVYIGSGSSGDTTWTDCSSAEDALRRYLDDDIQN